MFCMNKLYFYRNLFVIDWRHKRLKNTIYLLLFYEEHLYAFLRKVMKRKLAKVLRKHSVVQKTKPALKRTFFFFQANLPANIRLDEEVLKTSWRRLSSSSSEYVLKTSFVFVFRRRLEDVFKMSWSRRICSP